MSLKYEPRGIPSSRFSPTRRLVPRNRIQGYLAHEKLPPPFDHRRPTVGSKDEDVFYERGAPVPRRKIKLGTDPFVSEINRLSHQI